MAIELYATAGSVEKDLRNHVVIVVDVLRATSVMVTAVEHGVRFIIPVSEVEEAVDMARQLGNQRVLLCGERQAKPIPEFHPVSYTHLDVYKRQAQERNIPWQLKRGTTGGNDAGSIQRSQGGVATAVVSVPCRYIHGPSSVCALSDVENQYRWVKAFLDEGGTF